MRTTPGPLGYVVAVGVSMLLVGLALPIDSLLAGDLGDYLLGVGLYTIFIVFYGVFFAVPGVIVVHLVSLRLQSQWSQVLVTAVVGCLAGLAASALLLGIDAALFVVPCLGVATGVGRVAAIPLVPAVRASWRPVDNDFAGTPRRW